MDTAANIAAAIWSHSPRSLVSGTPGTPATQAEVIAEAVWQYGTRTLTSSPAPTQWYPSYVDPMRRNKVPVTYG